jgi:hypothetical protein
LTADIDGISLPTHVMPSQLIVLSPSVNITSYMKGTQYTRMHMCTRVCTTHTYTHAHTEPQGGDTSHNKGATDPPAGTLVPCSFFLRGRRRSSHLMPQH